MKILKLMLLTVEVLIFLCSILYCGRADLSRTISSGRGGIGPKTHQSIASPHQINRKNTSPKQSTSNLPHDEHIDPPPIPKHIPWKDYHPQNNVVAFYNLYIGKGISAYLNIVHEQLDIMNMTGLLSRLDAMYYVTIGRHYQYLDGSVKARLNGHGPPVNERKPNPARQPGYNPSIPPKGNPTSKFLHLHNTVYAVDETLTLSYLYDFCQHHRHSIVLYFHDKGSFHYSLPNVYFRNFLDCYVLNPSCLDTLLTTTTTSDKSKMHASNDSNGSSGFDTCGWRFSPIPNTHYSGNYWWAKCSYVNTLISPSSMIYNATFANVTKSLSHSIVSSRRYLPEAWIGSGPNIKPADCMSDEIDGGSFLCCYDLHNISISQCPNHIKHYGETDYSRVMRQRLTNLTATNGGVLPIGATSCKAAQVLENPNKYQNAYNKQRGFHEHRYHDNIVKEMVKRSQLWYGTDPTSYLNMIKPFDIIDKQELSNMASKSSNEKFIIFEPHWKRYYEYYSNHTIVEIHTTVLNLTISSDRAIVVMPQFKINMLLSSITDYNS